jgi:flagellar hook-associated protein 2
MDILSSGSTTSSSSSAYDSYSASSVTGLVDNINVDSIVKSLMMAANAPVDTLDQQIQTLQWKQQDYQSINTDLQNLQNSIQNLKLQGTYMTKQVTSSSSAVSATATISALNTSHQVIVSGIATSAVLASQAAVTAISSGGDTLSSDGVTAGSFTINDGTNQQTFNVTSTTTLNNVISDINSSGLNVEASWDSSLQRFYLSATQAGTTVTATDTSGDLMQTLLGNSTNTASGSDASVEVDGTSYTFSSNQFEINGISYTVQGTTGNSPAVVTVTNDVSSVVSGISSFVTEYNNTMTDLNNMLSQTVYSDYPPLTQDLITTKDLDSTQQDAWTTKAKSGLLNGDPLLQSVVNDMEDAMTNPVSGLSGKVTVTNDDDQQETVLCNQASVVGLTSTYGTLSLDTSTLTEALQSNPQAVIALFTTTLDSSGDLITDSSQQGLMVRLDNTLTNDISELTNQAGTSGQIVDNSYIGQQVSSDNSQVSSWDTYLNNLESRYYKEFDSMEQALEDANVQSSWLSELSSSSSS